MRFKKTKMAQNDELQDKVDNWGLGLLLVLAIVFSIKGGEIIGLLGVISVSIFVFYWVLLYTKLKYKTKIKIKYHLAAIIATIFPLYLLLIEKIKVAAILMAWSVSLSLIFIISIEIKRWWSKH